MKGVSCRCFGGRKLALLMISAHNRPFLGLFCNNDSSKEQVR